MDIGRSRRTQLFCAALLSVVSVLACAQQGGPPPTGPGGPPPQGPGGPGQGQPSAPSTVDWKIIMTADSAGSPAVSPARHADPIYFTPFPFATVLQDRYSPPTLVQSASVSTRGRYLIATPEGSYLAFGASGAVERSTSMTTYRDVFAKLVEAVPQSGGSGTFRLDSELNALYSLDIESSTNGTLVFHNNWGTAAGTAAGYLVFRYDSAAGTLRAEQRYSYATSSFTHAQDRTFRFTGWCVHFANGRFSLAEGASDATRLTFYASPLDLSIPADFNPDKVEYQPNARVSIHDYVDRTAADVESSGSQFFRDLDSAYLPQVAAVGDDPGTRAAAASALDAIDATLKKEGGRLRYPKELYLAFRAGALNTVLSSDDIANGTPGMHTVPYVYFTDAADDHGVHHPFMVVVSYSISDKPNHLVDVARPPGDGSHGGYAEQNVTRDATLQFYLVKIPLRDYGLVSAMTENTLPRTLRKDVNGTAPDTVYNYASTSAVGVAVDGVVIYPPLNNTLASAQESAEITSTGIHVGRGMGLHYHADGHTAARNDFSLYGINDYSGQSHSPLIGFALDGIALFGSYEKVYPGMEGADTPLDEYGGHAHGALGYHYHAHLVAAKTADAVGYTLHVLLSGAWKGKINAIPDFWDDQKGEPAYAMSQHTKWVGMLEPGQGAPLSR